MSFEPTVNQLTCGLKGNKMVVCCPVAVSVHSVFDCKKKIRRSTHRKTLREQATVLLVTGGGRWRIHGRERGRSSVLQGRGGGERCVCSVRGRSCVRLVQLCVISSSARCQFAFVFSRSWMQDCLAHLIQECRHCRLVGRCVQDSGSGWLANPLHTHVGRGGDAARLCVFHVEPLLLGFGVGDCHPR